MLATSSVILGLAWLGSRMSRGNSLAVIVDTKNVPHSGELGKEDRSHNSGGISSNIQQSVIRRAQQRSEESSYPGGAGRSGVGEHENNNMDHDKRA